MMLGQKRARINTPCSLEKEHQQEPKIKNKVKCSRRRIALKRKDGLSDDKGSDGTLNELKSFNCVEI
jgi:hypothetical protein